MSVGDPLANRIVHVDASFLIIDKPSGLLSVPGRGPEKADCVSARVQRDFSDALIVHRLDMATSGLLLMARTPAAQSRLNLFFETRQVGKTYHAIVAGRVAQAAGEIDLPLGADWINRPRQIVDPVQGKPARTRYSLLAYDAASNTSRLELEPLTGRTHQLRVHLQAIGHPIVGDPLYAPPAACPPGGRLLLHASELAFLHPVHGTPLSFSSPPPF
jgi:tRNA pseudouridine32 synthase / 23S rRNA pseudouridine746 synthase